MKFHKKKERHDVLKKIFRQAYYEKEKIPVNDHWQHGVMRRIRNLKRVEPGVAFYLRFEQVLWKLTPAVCLMILCLAVVLYHFEIVPDYSVFQALGNGEEELSISQLAGI